MLVDKQNELMSDLYSPPAWRRWRNVKTTYIDVVVFFFFYLINIQLKLRLKIAEPLSSDILFVTHNIKSPTSKQCLTNHNTVRRFVRIRDFKIQRRESDKNVA